MKRAIGTGVTLALLGLSLSGCREAPDPPARSAVNGGATDVVQPQPVQAAGDDAIHTLRIGSKLYAPDGTLWGTVVQTEAAHTFPNGDTEAGVLVDYGPRMGEPFPPQWLPRRSAERFRIE